MNGVDYSRKLTVTERQWLHAFNSEHFKGRPREDAMDQHPEELRVGLSAPQDGIPSFQAPETYLGVTLVDLKLYLKIEKDGVPERQVSREESIPRSTLKYRMRLVQRILEQISWSNLFGNLSEEKINDEIIPETNRKEAS